MLLMFKLAMLIHILLALLLWTVFLCNSSFLKVLTVSMCVPIPGETEWCQNLYLEFSQSARYPSVSVPQTNNNNSAKRKLDEDEDDMEVPENTSDATSASRRQRTQDIASNNSNTPSTNSPHHSEGGCLVKVQSC